MTGASVANLQRIGQGKQGFGFTMAEVARGAENGLGKLKNHKAKARTLMVPFPRKVQVATTEGWAIEKLADFKGKRMSIGEPNRGTEALAVCAVIAAPVLTRPGAPDCAAHMFIFYWRELGPQVVWIVFTVATGIGAIAGGAQNWVLVRCHWWSRLAPLSAQRRLSSGLVPPSRMLGGKLDFTTTRTAP